LANYIARKLFVKMQQCFPSGHGAVDVFVAGRQEAHISLNLSSLAVAK
jgi:hypothetical protein